MNSFKKIGSLLAVIAVSISLSTLPAMADNENQNQPFSVLVSANANTTTSVAPRTVAVPTSNVIDAGHSVAISATADTSTVVTFTASPTVKLVSALSTELAPKTVSSGVASLSATSAGSAVTVYAYTTSTATGYVTIVNGSYSTVVFVKGTAGAAANISVAVPSSTAVGTIPTISVSATDVFGNPVGSESISVSLIGSTFTNGTITAPIVTSATTSASGVTPVAVLGTGTATLTTAVAGSITVVATDNSIVATATGLPVAVKSAIATFVVSDLAAEVASLKAQLAAEKAGRAADKVLADKTLADALAKAKADLDIERLAIARSADLNIAAAKSASDKVLADAIASNTASYNALVVKYNKLVASHVAKAKKYKFSTTVATVATK
jgi:hypothetical protein